MLIHCVLQCYKWYCKFLSFAPQTEIETEFIAECRQYLEGDKGASPPEEWLNYIMQELAAIDNEIYSTNATILIKRYSFVTWHMIGQSVAMATQHSFLVYTFDRSLSASC